MNFYSKKVIDSFFQTFYDERVSIANQVGHCYNKQLDLSILLFWFSVIDFYGGIYYVGKHNKKEKYRDGRLKLAHPTSFIEYIETFFPSPDNKVGQFIYKIFRSGIVHQISPRKGEIVWNSSEPKLVWVKVDTANTNDTANKVAVINIYKLQELTFRSYDTFKTRISRDLEMAVCENIFNQLLKDPDGLEDGKTLNDQYQELLSRGITI